MKGRKSGMHAISCSHWQSRIAFDLTVESVLQCRDEVKCRSYRQLSSWMLQVKHSDIMNDFSRRSEWSSGEAVSVRKVYWWHVCSRIATNRQGWSHWLLVWATQTDVDFDCLACVAVTLRITGWRHLVEWFGVVANVTDLSSRKQLPQAERSHWIIVSVSLIFFYRT